jgi:hypothetical protein
MKNAAKQSHWAIGLNSLLDRTICLREVLRWGRWVFYFVAAIYVVVLVIHEWNLKMSGTSERNSPFLEQVPIKCISFGSRHNGIPPNRKLLDILLMKGRINHLPIVDQNGRFTVGECLGFATILGLHASPISSANFIDDYVDDRGNSIVTVHVEYHQRYTTQTTGSQK